MSKDRYSDPLRYFSELERTSAEYYVPYLSPLKAIGEGCRVLEIGCGQGGNLAPFAAAGCSVTGVDLAAGKIESARRIFAQKGLQGTFFCENFLSPSELGGRYDIVLVHDVIEHIEPPFKADFFKGIRKYCADGATVFFGFPVWQMPLGGHQQSCRSRWDRIPWLHLLPAGPYERWLRRHGESDDKVSDLLSIWRSRMTANSFERLAAETGYEVIRSTYWLINPHYKAKFGLRPVKLPRIIAHIPGLGNALTTSAHYLIRPVR